jgi:hypothetical protein
MKVPSQGKGLEDFLRTTELVGRQESTGHFEIVPEQALSLLNRYRLPNPLCFVSLFLRSIIQLGAPEVRVKSGKARLEVCGPDAATEEIHPEKIRELLETPLTSLASPLHRMVVALQLARALGYKKLDYRWDDGHHHRLLKFSDTGLVLEDSASTGEGRVELSFEPLESGRGFAREVARQLKLFEFAPRPVWVNGSQINGHLICSGHLAVGYFPVKSATVESVACYGEPPIRNPDFGRPYPLQWYSEKPCEWMEVTRARTRRPFKRYSDTVPILERFIALSPTLDRSIMAFVSQGAVNVSLVTDEIRGVEVITHARGLNWDLSGLGLREDESLETTLMEIYQEALELVGVCLENAESLRLRTESSLGTFRKTIRGATGGALLAGGCYLLSILAGLPFPLEPMGLVACSAGGWHASKDSRSRDLERVREDRVKFLHQLKRELEAWLSARTE